MARKQKITYHSYYEGSIRYLACSVCGHYQSVGEEAVAVKCSNCTARYMMSKFPPEENKSTYKPTGRPPGWHWMAEFVDKDGNVFHKGKEQPKLKGTLAPTKVKEPKKKTKRRSRDEILVAKYKEKQALKRAIKKQKKFLNHDIDKNK
jgi:hypothetical protein|tara:strand:- start:307 stop:750 length:444 start_codon:yes stop_codon:yes gene_type:complete